MSQLKLAAAFSNIDNARQFARESEGLLLTSDKPETSHLPFAALFLGINDDVEETCKAADAGVFLVHERAMKNRALSDLNDEELPVSVGIFTMVANKELSPLEADRYWRDQHAPLALRVHTAMTHYYQLHVLHRFAGPGYNGFALCCFASEDDLRNRFYNSRVGQAQIAADIALFANTTKSPRRVVASLDSP